MRFDPTFKIISQNIQRRLPFERRKTGFMDSPSGQGQPELSTKQEVFEKTVKIKAHTGEGKIDLFKIMLQAAACRLKCLMEIDDGTIGRNTEVVNF